MRKIDNRFLSGIVVITCLFATIGQAQPPGLEDAKICDAASLVASRKTGVPLNILKAVARTETGVTVKGEFTAWPWTINVEGNGVRLPTKPAAAEHFRANHERGVRNIDVGCFQINHKWHGRHFPTLSEMLDPVKNAQYAAIFLQELFEEYNNWELAVGAYHSRTPELAYNYLGKFRPILSALNSGSYPKAKNSPHQAFENTFPLLTGSSNSRARGSLFPEGSSSGGNLLTPRGARG